MRAGLMRYVVCCFGAVAIASTVSGQTRFTTVVIDPGHGGFDRGGIPGQRVLEKNMTLDVSLRLKPILEKAGYRVIMTRSTDIFVPLGTRVGIANSYPNAIFSASISTPPRAAEPAALRRIFTARKAPRS